MSGKSSFKNCNMFIDLAVKLQRAIDTSNIIKVRQAICEVLYLASLKLANVKRAKLLTDECGNVLNNDTESKVFIETL